MDAQHTTVKLVSRNPFAPDAAHRRAFIRKLVDATQRWGLDLLAANLADNHGHILTAGGRSGAGRMVQNVECSLHFKALTDSGFQPANITPIENARHLENTFWYVVDQARHHDLVDLDPLHEASLAPDLLGFRELAVASREAVRWHLPRVNGERIQRVTGLVKPESAPVHLIGLKAATEAALGVAALNTRRKWDRAGLDAAVALGHEMGFRRDQVRREMGVSSATLFRAVAREPATSLQRAIRFQLQLRLGMRSGSQLPR